MAATFHPVDHAAVNLCALPIRITQKLTMTVIWLQDMGKEWDMLVNRLNVTKFGETPPIQRKPADFPKRTGKELTYGPHLDHHLAL